MKIDRMEPPLSDAHEVLPSEAGLWRSGRIASPVDISASSSILAGMAKRPTKKPVTLIDLGKKLNLSPRAVSQALHGGKCTVRISPATRKRVQEMAKAMNYRPNRLAQILRKGTSGLVGILAVQQFGYLIQQELFFARKFAEEGEWKPNIYLLPDRQDASCHRAVDFMLDAKVDGILIIGDFLRKTHVQRILDAQVPVVSVASPNVPDVPRIYADKKAGFASLAEHLIEKKVKQLRLLINHPLPVPKTLWHSWSAVEGSRSAVNKAIQAGKSVDFEILSLANKIFDIKVNDCPVHGYYATGYLSMKEIIANGNVPEALMCQADNVVHGALLACAEHGIRVPDQMMITGFEDDAASSAGLLPITSVSQPVSEMLRLAFWELKGITEGSKSQESRSMALPCQLMARQSTNRSS